MRLLIQTRAQATIRRLRDKIPLRTLFMFHKPRRDLHYPFAVWTLWTKF